MARNAVALAAKAWLDSRLQRGHSLRLSDTSMRPSAAVAVAASPVHAAFIMSVLRVALGSMWTRSLVHAT